MTKIAAAHITSFKRIEDIKITPDADRALLLIAGMNAQGKTSVMDALTVAFGGADCIPPDPVRHGAEVASVRIDLDDGMTVIRTIYPDGETTLELRDADGKLNSPQKRLDKMIGARFLDPLKFLGKSAADQRKALLALIDRDGKVPALDEKRKRVFGRRTEINRDHDKAAAELENIPAVSPAASISLEDLTRESAAIEESIASYNRCKAEHDEIQRRTKARQEQIDTIERELTRLAAQLETLEAEAAEDAPRLQVSAGAPTAQPPPDVAERRAALAARFNAANEHNRKVAADEAAAARRAHVAAEVTRFSEAADKLTADLDQIDAEKAEVLAEAKLPVEGLDVDEAGVRFRGVPLSQASGAEQLRVALALAIAAAPNLRDVWVRDGEKLDDDSLALLAREAESAGVRVWVERVGDRDPGAIVIHDGRIRETAQLAAS